MVPMAESDTFSIDCRTCVATGTTACADCVVSQVLANSAGPIELIVSSPGRATSDPDPAERAVELFAAAGLLDAEPVFVAPDDFGTAHP